MPHLQWRRRARRFWSAVAAGVLGLSIGAPAVAQPASAAGPSFTNPVVGVPNSADPTLVSYNGAYYYVATTWGPNVVMRRSTTMAGLRSAPEQVVVRTGGDTMWAPHLEMVGDRWYLYYSVEGFSGARRTHVAESAGSDPLGPYTVRGILNLMPNNGWAIDASLLRLNNALYMTFSAFASDGLQSLFIAPMANPWTASGVGTRISAPMLPWERQNGAVNEGSFPLQRNGRTFLTYSASHCKGPNYKLGMLEYRGGNPLSQGSWYKFPNPIFERNDAARVFGPGHHSFFSSPDGTETWIAYHANDSAGQHCGKTRTTRVQKLTWNADGTPNLGRPVSTSTVLAAPSGENGGTVPAIGRTIRNRHSNLCLDDYNMVTSPGAEVRQWTCSNEPVQRWQLSDVGDGYVQIVNAHSGLCLDNRDWGTAAGAAVQQWTCNGLAVQQWRVTAVDGGFSTLINRHSGLCLDNYNFATAPGSEVRQWTCNNSAVQHWAIT